MNAAQVNVRVSDIGENIDGEERFMRAYTFKNKTRVITMLLTILRAEKAMRLTLFKAVKTDRTKSNVFVSVNIPFSFLSRPNVRASGTRCVTF